MVGQVTVMKTEAYGVCEALIWVGELQTQQVVVECDSSLVVQALQLRSDVGIFWKLVKAMLQDRSDS